MLFKKLKLKNIRSYESLDLEFPEGSILLSGHIGSGKTSILLGLQFALFGLQPGQNGNALLRQGSDNASVVLELDVDGKTVVIERGMKRGKGISQESSVLIIDGVRQELSTSEMKNRVITLLDYPREFIKKSNLLYKFTVYTPQEEMKAIVQEDPEVRLDTLRYIFGMDRYKRIKENAAILLQKVKDDVKIKEFEIREINLLKERFAVEAEKRIQLAREINNNMLEFTQLSEQRDAAEKRRAEVQQLLEEKQKLDSEMSKKEAELRGKKEVRARIEKELVLANRQIQEKAEFSQEKLANVLALLQRQKQSLEDLQSKLTDVKAAISSFNARRERSIKEKDSIIFMENCFTCLQPVTADHKHRISNRTDQDIEEMERLTVPKLEERDTLLRDLERANELIQGYDYERQQLERDKIKAQHHREIETRLKSDMFALDRVMQEIQDIEQYLASLQQKAATFGETRTMAENEKRAFDTVNLRVRNIEITLAEKRKESELLASRLDDLQEDIAKKEKVKEQIDYLRQLQDWLNERFLSVIALVEKNVMAKLRSEFSNIFNKWFSMLVSDSLSARLDEDFTPIITQQNYDLDYEFLSGGERTAVALAYRLALNQMLNSLLSKIKTKDILILDEPTDGFSEQQLDKMRDIFDEIKAKQIILVSHEQKIEGFVDKVVRIKKEGTSRIEQV